MMRNEFKLLLILGGLILQANGDSVYSDPDSSRLVISNTPSGNIELRTFWDKPELEEVISTVQDSLFLYYPSGTGYPRNEPEHIRHGFRT